MSRRRNLILRLAGLAVILGIWAGYLTATRGVGDEPTVDQNAARIIDDFDPIWHLEHLYLALTPRTDSTNTTESPAAAPNPAQTGYRLASSAGRVRGIAGKSIGQDDAFRVLALGDSYTYGFGLSDGLANWPSQLEMELTRRHPDRAIEVITVALPGASIFTHHDWMDELKGCRDGTGPCGEFEPLAAARIDAIVIGFFANDFFPTQSDRVYGQFGPADQTTSRDKRSPYEAIAGDAARGIVTAADGVDVYWMPLAGLGSHEAADNATINWNPDLWWSLVGDSGMIQVPVPNAQQTVRTRPAEDLLANPVDYHPSTILHHSYAVDAADALDAQVASSAPPRVDAPTELVTAGLPLSWVTTTDDGKTSVAYEPQTRWLCNGATVRRDRMTTLFWTVIDDLEISCDDPSRIQARMNGKRYPLPHQSCALLGRPNVQIAVNPHAAAGRDLTVDLVNGEGLSVSAYGYDDSGRLVLGTAQPLTGRIVVDQSDTTVRGLLIHKSETSGCHPYDRVNVGPFRLTIGTE